MTIHSLDWLGWMAVVLAVCSAGILVHHLYRRPALDRHVRLRLLIALGILPILIAGASNITGFKATQSREFCGSCHVMIPHKEDSENPNSTSLAAIHSRNNYFGHDNCYTCHKDYEMYGYVVTKIGGMRHVYYYLTKYHDMPLEESKKDIRINKPFPNSNCMQCHTTSSPAWLKIGDHASSLDRVRDGSLSCASSGCHGYAHPVTK